MEIFFKKCRFLLNIKGNFIKKLTEQLLFTYCKYNKMMLIYIQEQKFEDS